jgi:hypothetical protein
VFRSRRLSSTSISGKLVAGMVALSVQRALHARERANGKSGHHTGKHTSSASQRTRHLCAKSVRRAMAVVSKTLSVDLRLSCAHSTARFDGPTIMMDT